MQQPKANHLSRLYVSPGQKCFFAHLTNNILYTLKYLLEWDIRPLVLHSKMWAFSQQLEFEMCQMLVQLERS